MALSLSKSNQPFTLLLFSSALQFVYFCDLNHVNDMTIRVKELYSFLLTKNRLYSD